MMTFPSAHPPNTCGTRWLRRASESQPSSSEAGLNSTNWLFQNPPRASGAWRRPHSLAPFCYILTFGPSKLPFKVMHRKWHIPMAVMRGNRVGGNWLMKWDELKNSHGTLIDWCTGREWPLNCMTVIFAWWRLNIRFQRSSGRRTII